MMVSKTILSIGMLSGFTAGLAFAVNIETVPVGNTGNVADTRYASPGFGSVAYVFNIGKYEVTAGQYTEFLNKVAATDTYGLYNTLMADTTYSSGISQSGSSGSHTYAVAPSHINRPVNFISWGDAARFANWLHNGQPTGAQGAGTTERGAYTLDGATTDAQLLAVTRNSNWKWAITSEDEWYKAAYHKSDGATGNYFDYPTSNDTSPGQDMADVSGNNANHYTSPYTYPIQSPYFTTVAGEFQNSDSPYGTFDQGGNVYEWNEAVIGSIRVLRGGSFNYDTWDLHASYRYGGQPTYESMFTGFRVSAVPEPATVGLLVIGSLLVTRRRRGA